MTTTPTVSYSLVSAVKSCLNRYAQFSGRACRSEYWYWTLATVLVASILAIATGDFSDPDGESSIVRDLYNLAIFLPGLAVFVRRMHDIGRSGWNYFWCLLPLIGWIILLVYLCKPSAPANEYGEGPATPVA